MLVYAASVSARPEHVTVREWRIALRATMLEGGKRFHAKFVKGGKRFTLTAAGDLGYKPRTEKYTKWKRKAALLDRRVRREGVRYTIKEGGMVPNLLTGVLRDALNLPEFRGFPTRVRITYPLMPKYARTKPDYRKVIRPWTGKEVVGVTQNEAEDFNRYVESILPEQIRLAKAAIADAKKKV